VAERPSRRVMQSMEEGPRTRTRIMRGLGCLVLGWNRVQLGGSMDDVMARGNHARVRLGGRLRLRLILIGPQFNVNQPPFNVHRGPASGDPVPAPVPAPICPTWSCDDPPSSLPPGPSIQRGSQLDT
jgi:hypothetical protein